MTGAGVTRGAGWFGWLKAAFLIGGTFVLVLLADRFSGVAPYSKALAAAGAMAVVLYTSRLVAQGRQQAGIASHTLEHARERALAQDRESRRVRIAALKAQADARTSSVLIDQPVAMKPKRLESDGSVVATPSASLDLLGNSRLKLSALLTAEVFGQEPLRISRVRVPTPLFIDHHEGSPARPGDKPATLAVGVTMDRVGIGTAIREGGWAGLGGWVAPVEIDFESLNGEVTEHHHFTLELRPVVEDHGTGGGPFISGVETSLEYPHAPERHYRVDEIGLDM